MGCLFNILWHFPFFGFVFALFYALFGLLMCCTIILIPVGLGWLQFARFLLSPFSCAMVSRSDLEKVTGEKQNSAMAAFSFVIRILYFPFGCIAAVGALFTIAAEFLSIIGIPCGLVWAKSLATIFNPVNKVCVPKAVGDEIERMKSAETLSKYTGQNPNAPVNAQANAPVVSESSTREEEHKADDRPLVRTFDDNRLAEVVNNREMYNAELVAQCVREIEIRRKSESLSEKVAGFDDGKLREIMSGAGVYSDELIYSCEKEYDHRAQLKREEMERAAEQARIEREKEAEAERAAAAAARERRILWWKKWRVLVLAAIACVVVAISALIYVKVEETKQEKARLEQERQAEMRRIMEEQRQLEEQKQREEREKQEAEKRRREQQRREAERLKQEEAKILADESYRRSVGAYLVGEYHEKLNGVVFWVDKTYKHGKVLSVAEMEYIITGSSATEYGSFEDAKQWCKSLGGKWRLPTLKEWESLTSEIKNNPILKLKKTWYWSSTRWTLEDHHWIFGNASKESRQSGAGDTDLNYARAVSEF